MIKKPNASQMLALTTAARLAEMNEDDANEDSVLASEAVTNVGHDTALTTATSTTTTAAPKNKGGRPKGKREVAGKQTVHLDAARLRALQDMAADRNRSVHSLIIEGIDAVIGKPFKTSWKDV